MAIKFGFQALGGSIGGIIELALNIKDDWRGSISKPTYIALMTVMSLGVPFALLVPTAKQAQRTDGRPVVFHKQPSLAQELKILVRLLKKPAFLALLPLFIYSQWFLSYQWQFNYAYFTVRARALNSTLFYLLGLFGALGMGLVLDWTRFKRSTRAKIGFVIIILTSGTGWILGQAVQAHYSKTVPTLDWDSNNYGLGAFVFALWGFADPM